MHELSIAMGLVDAACDELARLGPGTHVVALHVTVGAMSGVVPDALAFSFDVAAEGSAIAGARLEIREAPVTIHCVTCQTEEPLDTWPPLSCPRCGTPAAEVRGGRELRLTALEVLDDAPHR
jgi:hydrogenase nickel incorporation protein HypA/HybF